MMTMLCLVVVRAYLVVPSPSDPYVLVLDIDKTLYFQHGDLWLTMDLFRPHLVPFIQTLSKRYDIVLFTAANQEHATTVSKMITRRTLVPMRHVYFSGDAERDLFVPRRYTYIDTGERRIFSAKSIAKLLPYLQRDLGRRIPLSRVVFLDDTPLHMRTVPAAVRRNRPVMYTNEAEVLPHIRINERVGILIPPFTPTDGTLNEPLTPKWKSDAALADLIAPLLWMAECHVNTTHYLQGQTWPLTISDWPDCPALQRHMPE